MPEETGTVANVMLKPFHTRIKYISEIKSHIAATVKTSQKNQEQNITKCPKPFRQLGSGAGVVQHLTSVIV